MKKTMRIIVTLVMVLTLVATLATSVAAIGINIVNADAGNANTEGIQSIGNNIAKVVKVVGIFVAVIIIMVLGVRYMMGSAEEKAEYKKVMIPYLIGAVLLFGASFFADKIYTWASNIGN